MKIPLSLIRSFIDLDISPPGIAAALTLLGIEVDSMENGEIETGDNSASCPWDPVFVITLTPNLGHCMSALGIARELSAAFQKPLNKISHAKIPEGSNKNIQVAQPSSSLCTKYVGRYIENVSIGPSPSWLKKQLLSCGFAPVCNAVDIANHILIKFGQPLHVFDADQLHGGLFVDTAKRPQKFSGLDEVEREIPEGTIVIADSKEPVAIAGILGGKNSAVSHKTKNIFIEAAVFDATKIRIAGKKMGLRTESSQRFEKGVDPMGTENAMDAALSLIIDLCGGIKGKGINWEKEHLGPKRILLRPFRVNRLLGTRLSITEMEEIFQRLHFHTEPVADALAVDVPLFRSDIAEEIDLIEEIARIYGYNHIEKSRPESISSQIAHDPVYLFEKKTREHLIGLGLQEWINPDLIGKKLAKTALEWMRPGAALLQVIHAKTEEYSNLRPSLLPGLLQAARTNFNHKNFNLEAFEIGRIHFLQNNGLVEEPMTALLLSGKNRPVHWSQKAVEFDFFDLKGRLENLFIAMRIPFCVFTPSRHLSFHPERQADLFLGDLRIGSLGEIHPALLEMFEIRQRIFYAEIHLHHILEQHRTQTGMKPLVPFPSSERDWTVALPLSTLIQTIFDTIHSARALLLENVELIDLYIPENGTKKHATFRFVYRDPLKTISFEEVETAHAKLIGSIEKFLAK